jgi:excisionase family DNA binding protein
MANEFLTTGEVAELLHCSKQWVSHLAREGAIKSYRLQKGGWHRIERSSLEEYVKHFNIPVDWSKVGQPKDAA